MDLPVAGLDFAWGAKPYDVIERDGARFVMRYLSLDPGKDLTKNEKDEWLKRKIGVGVVWETTSGRALAGYDAGRRDADAANRRLGGIGLAGLPVYFAVDFDATEAQKPAIVKYLTGAASIIGWDRVGVYGGYWVVKHMVDRTRCRYFWQTYAWSGGLIHPRTHIYQYKNGVRVGGLSCDRDHARAGDIGVRFPAVADPKAHKRQVWRSHLRASQRQLAALQRRVKRLRQLTGAKT